MARAKIIVYLIVPLVYFCLLVPCAKAALTFGPEKYVRTTGKPNVYTKNFFSTAGPAKLIVLNGEPNGQNTLSNALIWINGVQVFAGDLDQRVYRLERMVSLLESSTIQVELRSNPGSYLTLSIEPVVTVAATDPSAAEGTPTTDTGTFTVTRTGNTASAMTVNYVVSGTATPGADYITLPGSVTIPDNQASATITVTPIYDNLVEENETVVLTLTASAGAYSVGSSGSSATVTIVDYVVPAGPSLAANPTNLAPGSALTASWSGIPNPTATDWIGLYALGAADGSFQTWVYVSCSQTAGPVKASGSCPFVTSPLLAAGTYELRLFANDGYSRLATSNAFTLSPITIVTTNLAAGTSGVTYNQTLTASGGTGSYAWSVVSGATLPPGLTLSPGGAISGTPNSTGKYSFTLQVQDSLLATATGLFSLVVSPNSSQLTIITPDLPAGMVSTPYNATLSASGGTGSYSWSLAAGSPPLPRGLFLAANGVISGVPIELGTSVLTVQVADGLPSQATASYMITSQTSTSSSCCNGFTKAFTGYWSFDDGTAFDDSGYRSTGTLVNNPQLVAGKIRNALSFNGTSQYVDVGPVLDPGTGHLSIFAWVKTAQTPNPGGRNIIISKLASDVMAGYELFENDQGAVSFFISDGTSVLSANSTGPQINDGGWHLVGAVFTRTASGGNGVIYVDGAPATGGPVNVPALSSSNIATTATLRFGVGDQTNQGLFWNGAIDEVRVLTRRSLSAQEVAEMYDPHPTFVSDTLPNGANGVPYNQTLTVAGGTLPYFWSVPPGSLPAGLSLSQNGTISGTPTATGSFSFTVQVTDLALRTATQTFNLTINLNPPQLLFSDNFSGTLGANWIAIDEGSVNAPSSWIISNSDVIQQSEIEDPIGPDEDGLPPIDPVKPGTFLLYTANPVWNDYDFSLRLMSESPQAIGVMFRFLDQQNYYRFSMNYRATYRRLVKKVNGLTIIVAEDAVPIEMGHSYTLRVSVKGDHIQIFLDQKQIVDVHDASIAQGKIALYTWGNVNSHFGDVLVTSQ